MINWNGIWMNLFGTTQWMGLDIGFWVALFVCLMVIVLMNIIVWGIYPNKSVKQPNRK